jgi:protein O-GlcNAc transferase
MDIQQLYNQAQTAQKGGNLVEAERLYRQILSQATPPEVLVNLGNLLSQQQGRRDEALTSYDKALAVRPGFFEALFNRGNLLLEMKRAEDALDSYEQALVVRQDFAGVWNNRGTALRNLQRLEEALASFEQAAALAPGHFNALTNRAIVLLDLGRLQDALAGTERALQVQPGFAEALYVRGNVLRDMGRPDEALASYDAAVAANPAHAYALNGAAQAARMLCDWTRTAALWPRVKANAAGGPALIQPFVLLGYSDDAALQRRCAETYVRRILPGRTAPLWDGTRYGHDRIRLAYLSADFHQHPTAQLMAELFERHDRSRFEVTAIAFGPDDGSALRTRMKNAFDHFEDVRGRSDLDVARLMRSREIDIAVDLNGHSFGARPGIFAHRACPVQVNYLVYPGTTGADFMDYILADRIALPADQQPFFAEKIVHLPDCYQANDATRAVPPAPGRAEAGLPPGGFVFCCFNNSWKLTAPLFDIWMRLLNEIEGSVLWLLDGPQADNLRKEAVARGVDAKRLVFAPKLPPDAHLARHQLADLFLDTLPYNAHTTCSDALWAGLVVVTCYGKAFPGRVAASLLKAIDLPELVTTSPEKYEELALELARNPALLKATKEKLARNRTTTPLYDSERFRKAIEAAYTAMLT